jgi:alpha-tubulin suppressor-like RCC1 family protein
VVLGDNDFGQLGDGTMEASFTPVAVAGLSGVTALAAGDLHNCALKEDDSVWCWGANAYGALGDGTVADPPQDEESRTRFSSTPVAVAGVSGARAIGAGGVHSCAVLNDGAVWCWGRSDAGQLGDGPTVYSDIRYVAPPVRVLGLNDAVTVEGGENYTCAATREGNAFCWGNSSLGQLGNGTRDNPSPPEPVVDLGDAISVSAPGPQLCREGNRHRVVLGS